MLETVMATLDASVEGSVMVGDRLQTDIRMAVDTGMVSAAVLTGETTVDEIAASPAHLAPQLVLDRVDRLIPAALWDELGWTESDPT